FTHKLRLRNLLLLMKYQRQRLSHSILTVLSNHSVTLLHYLQLSVHHQPFQYAQKLPLITRAKIRLAQCVDEPATCLLYILSASALMKNAVSLFSLNQIDDCWE